MGRNSINSPEKKIKKIEKRIEHVLETAALEKPEHILKDMSIIAEALHEFAAKRTGKPGKREGIKKGIDEKCSY